MQGSPPPIDEIRTHSRRLVRALGFMGGAFAGTDLPPSAVHALIEIDARPGITARSLSDTLRLEKSSISRLLRKLIERHLVKELADADDQRAKPLHLTADGLRQVQAIHIHARRQVAGALGHLAPEDVVTVTEGLRLYAQGLTVDAGLDQPSIEVVSGYRPGLIARVTQMHADYYAREAGFGQRFESVVAGGLAAFCDRLDHPDNAVWLAVCGGRLLGSIAIDGADLGPGIAHLRWFIVDDELRGSGVGRRLMAAAVAFVDTRDFVRTDLWTFDGLRAARHLYQSHGFVLAEQRPGDQWGREVLEQRFTRSRPAD